MNVLNNMKENTAKFVRDTGLAAEKIVKSPRFVQGSEFAVKGFSWTVGMFKALVIYLHYVFVTMVLPNLVSMYLLACRIYRQRVRPLVLPDTLIPFTTEGGNNGKIALVRYNGEMRMILLGYGNTVPRIDKVQGVVDKNGKAIVLAPVGKSINATDIRVLNYELAPVYNPVCPAGVCLEFEEESSEDEPSE